MALNTENGLFALPKDVLLNIVSYLEPEDILHCTEMISKSWKRASYSIWQHFCEFRFSLDCLHHNPEECRAKVISYCQCARILYQVIENPKVNPWYRFSF